MSPTDWRDEAGQDAAAAAAAVRKRLGLTDVGEEYALRYARHRKGLGGRRNALGTTDPLAGKLPRPQAELVRRGVERELEVDEQPIPTTMPAPR